MVVYVNCVYVVVKCGNELRRVFHWLQVTSGLTYHTLVFVHWCSSISFRVLPREAEGILVGQRLTFLALGVVIVTV